MVKALIEGFPIDEHSTFQIGMSLPAGYAVTRNGKPVLHCDTRLEALCELRRIQKQQRAMCPKSPEKVIPLPTEEDIFGKEK